MGNSFISAPSSRSPIPLGGPIDGLKKNAVPEVRHWASRSLAHYWSAMTEQAKFYSRGGVSSS